MTHLIIPAAGASSRYNFDRPKFLLNHPLGGTMIEHSIKGLGDLTSHGITEVIIVSLEKYFDDISSEKLETEISNEISIPVKIILLSEPTNSMVSTLVKAIEFLGMDLPIIIKDSDNLVEIPAGALMDDRNLICSLNIVDFPTVRADNKSFLKINSENILENIVEKRIISNQINVGCIKIKSSSDFLSCALELQGPNEIYVSDIVRTLLERGQQFFSVPVTNYEDWGTGTDWLNFTNKFKTLFVDIDGVVAVNENPLSRTGGWERFRPIEENCNALLKIMREGKCHLIFTTSRSEKYRTSLESELKNFGFQEFDLIMGLMHSKRVLINDFAATNPYPSAISINLERNSRNLGSYLN
jgi:hypothetical protein